MKVGDLIIRRVSGRPGLDEGDVCRILEVQSSRQTSSVFARVQLLRTGRELHGTWRLDLFNLLEPAHDDA